MFAALIAAHTVMFTTWWCVQFLKIYKRVYSEWIEQWTIYRTPCFLDGEWFGSMPTPSLVSKLDRRDIGRLRKRETTWLLAMVGEVSTVRSSDNDTNLSIVSADLFYAFYKRHNRFIASNWRILKRYDCFIDWNLFIELGFVASSLKNGRFWSDTIDASIAICFW